MRGLEIEHKLEMSGLFHRYFSGRIAFDDLNDMPCRLAIHVGQVRAIREEPAGVRVLAEVESGRQPSLDRCFGDAGPMKKSHGVEYKDHSTQLFLGGHRQSALDVFGLADVERRNDYRLHDAGALRFPKLRNHPLVTEIEGDSQSRKRGRQVLHDLYALRGKIRVDTGHSGQIFTQAGEVGYKTGCKSVAGHGNDRQLAGCCAFDGGCTLIASSKENVGTGLDEVHGKRVKLIYLAVAVFDVE